MHHCAYCPFGGGDLCDLHKAVINHCPDCSDEGFDKALMEADEVVRKYYYDFDIGEWSSMGPRS